MAESVVRPMIISPGLRLYRFDYYDYYFAFALWAHGTRCAPVWIPCERSLAPNRNAFAGYSRWFIVFLFSRLSICKYNSFLSNAKSQYETHRVDTQRGVHPDAKRHTATHRQKNASREIGMTRMRVRAQRTQQIHRDHAVTSNQYEPHTLEAHRTDLINRFSSICCFFRVSEWRTTRTILNRIIILLNLLNVARDVDETTTAAEQQICYAYLNALFHQQNM